MDTKSFSRVDIKSEDKGQVTAVFSTFDSLDSDGDITLKDAFDEGAEAPISQYGHTSWGGALPVGRARLRTSGKEAILDGQFFMDTMHGRDAFLTVKQLGNLGQWSYGYRVLDAEYGELDGRKVRYLKRLAVDEFSPVLVGAGVNTRTLATKGLSPNASGGTPVGFEYKAAIRPHDTAVTSGTWDAGAAVKGIPENASVSDLRSMFAWVDSDGDPETKSAYKFPHHTSVGGAANIRACVFGIAAINGARGGASIPEADRKGVYNHLAAHLRDADREPPELRSGSADGWKTRDDRGRATVAHYEELAVVLSDWMELNARTAEVVALRARKGRALLPAASLELQQWIDEEVQKQKHLLTSADEEARYEYLRFLRSQLGE